MSVGERISAERRGRRSEAWAAWALRLKGYRILAMRYRTPLGEIDIIARRGSVVAMVEVKARATLRDAMEAVGPAAQRRIMAAADLYASRIQDHHRVSIRFDLIAVLPRRWPIHVERAFEP